MASEMESDRLLHQAIGKLFERRGDDLNVYRVSCLLDTLRRTPELLCKVELGQRFNALLLCHGLN